jgi:hypothetical protein
MFVQVLLSFCCPFNYRRTNELLHSVIFNRLNFERAGAVLCQVFQTLDHHTNTTLSTITSHTAGNMTASNIKTLSTTASPAAVSRTEKLFLPSKYGENMIKTWSTWGLKDPRIISEYMRLFAKERVIVSVNSRPLTSWVDAWLVQCGLRPGTVVRKPGQGVPVVLCPELLVHIDAAPIDVLRALIIVHRVLHDCTQQSNRAVEFGLNSTSILEMVKSAYAYEQMNFANIASMLHELDWATDKFMFGNINHRVEW